MDAFSYLSVLISIIIGLAITQVLQGYRVLLLARHAVRPAFAPLAWSVYLLLMATQMWWASFGLAHHTDWSFAGFSLILVQTVLLYMMTALVLPDDAGDLTAHYWREARPFYALLVLVLATSLAKDWVIDGHLPGAENLSFHGIFAAVAIVAIVSRRRRLHDVLVAAMGVLLLAYVALLFARLPLA